jgi:putative phosphoesterase
MLIAVFSDSHGAVEPMLAAAKKYSPDLIIHLGDYSGDANELKKELPGTPIKNVQGNCDFVSDAPEREIFQLCGKTFFLAHGHRYGVKSGTDALLTTAMCAGADIVMYGHTHIADLRSEGNMLVLNPGSVGRGRPKSFALLSLEEGAEPTAEIIFV